MTRRLHQSANDSGGTPLCQPAGRRRSVRTIAIAIALATGLPAFAATSTTPAKLPGKVGITQKLNSRIPLDLMFRNERGEIVRLNQYFNQGKPVLLEFVYFRCPMLCPMVLEGTAEALTHLKFDIGKEFDVISVSIDPRDKASTAAELKDKYIKHYGRLDSAPGWHFLTSNETAIKRLADSVGFEFAYDPQADQFAHGAALMVLTPDGRLARYFYGFEYRPRDLRLAIVEASAGKAGTVTDQFLLLCYHYDPATGKYSRNAMAFARVGGITTVLVLGGFIFVMLRRERRQSDSSGPAKPPAHNTPEGDTSESDTSEDDTRETDQ